MDYAPGVRLAAAFFIPENFALGVRVNQPGEDCCEKISRAAKEFREQLRSTADSSVTGGEGME